MRDIAGNCLSLAHGDPHAAKERIKRANVEMKQNPMNSEQYSAIRQMLDEAWEAATKTASEKQDEWRERMENHVERWTELYEKNEDVVAKLEQQIEECEEMESNAKSDDFAERVRGWIDEKMAKIRDIQRTNRELEEKIRSAKSKLSK
jgi:acyl-CoA reductase-like NAD-dependent aldehyde dehydrogenase